MEGDLDVNKKKKRERRGYVGNLYTKNELRCGKRLDKIRIVNPLLPVGTIVTVWDIGIFDDAYNFTDTYRHFMWEEDAESYHTNGKVRRHTFLKPYGELDVNGNVKKYIIDAYTDGIDCPLGQSNKAHLTRIIDGDRAEFDRLAISTLLIATGSCVMLTEKERVEKIYAQKYILKDKERFSYLA